MLNKENIYQSFIHHDLEKSGGVAQFGEIRTWKGKDYQKMSDGKWKYLGKTGESKTKNELNDDEFVKTYSSEEAYVYINGGIPLTRPSESIYQVLEMMLPDIRKEQLSSTSKMTKAIDKLSEGLDLPQVSDGQKTEIIKRLRDRKQFVELGNPLEEIDKNGESNKVEDIKLEKDDKGKLKLPKKKEESKIIYFSTFSEAVQTAREIIEKRGYEIDENDWFTEINVGVGRPKEGQTNRFTLGLTKNGKPVKQSLHIQVYNRGNNLNKNFELNFYVS